MGLDGLTIMSGQRNSSGMPIGPVLADVDSTRETRDKLLTPHAVAAVGQPGNPGVPPAITGSRRPRGVRILIEPLRREGPVAAFNGGAVDDERVIRASVVPVVIHTLAVFGCLCGSIEAPTGSSRVERATTGARSTDGGETSSTTSGRQQATFVTVPIDEARSAKAIEQFVLPRTGPAPTLSTG